jgi:hypothetical protein
VRGATPELFLQENKIARMGVPPFRIEILTAISGVGFSECYAERVVDKIDGVEVNLISLKSGNPACGKTRSWPGRG